MKIILCAFLIAFTGPLFSQSLNVLHYTYRVELNDSNNVVRCTALVKLKSQVSGVALDLADNMKISAIWNETSKRKLNYRHASNRVNIEQAADTGEIVIGITYSGIPKDGLIISKNKFGQRTFFTDHWPNRAHYWLVCHDHPSDKAGVDFIVKTPARYQVVSNGVQVEETNIDSRNKLTHWRETIDLPTKVMCIGVSEFAVNYAGDVGNVPVYSWVFPANKIKGFADYAIAGEVLPFFVEHIGPYPYKKLANVQSKTMFGGMENASAIFYYENSVTGNGKTIELIAHEIAHQWFGNMVTEADWPHVWLSEGFATYLEVMYMEHRFGRDTMVAGLKYNREKVIEFYKKVRTPVVDTTAKNFMNLLNANSYEKGGWVLHMLRRKVGDSLFWRGLRQYYTTFEGKNAVTEDFRTVMEEVSGMDLKQFFKQWLYTPGHPVLKVSKKFDNAKKMLTVTVTQQQAVPFQFQLTVGAGAFNTTVVVQDRETVLSIPAQGNVALVVDPQCDLLFE